MRQSGRKLWRAATLLALALAACGGGDDGAPVADAQPGPDATFVDLTEGAFDPDHLIEIDIDLASSDWNALRFQTRGVFDIFGPPCLTAPFPDPFTWFEADVTIDGEEIDQVAVRKKGFLGSLSDDKPSLILKLDEYVTDQSWSGLERVTLNNGQQDPSLIHQCLVYPIFAAAGIPAPRCNFAHVTVNGVDLGIYTHIESVKKPFLRRHFASDDGNLYEGTLSDFRDGWTVTFEKKTNESDPATPEIDAMLAVMNDSPDAQLLADLAPLIDVDEFISMWATEVLVGHWDGYASDTNNYFLYQDPTDDRLHMMPWGADAVFQDPNAPVVGATGVLARRLYLLPETQQRYADQLQALLDDVWDEDALHDEIDRMEALITPIADPDGDLGLDTQIDVVRTFVDNRRATVQTALTAGLPAWTQPLRDPLCFDEVGTVDLTFATTWGTTGGNPFTAGTATIDATYQGSAVAFTNTGSVAGLDDNGGPLIAPVGRMADGTVVFFALGMAPQLVTPGAHPIDLVAVTGYVMSAPPAPAMPSVIAYLRGTLTLTQASTVPGAPVTGTVNATMLWWW